MDWDGILLGPVMGIFGEGVSDPAKAAVFTPAGVGATPITLPDAVFDRAYVETTLGRDGVPVQTRKPVLGVRAASFPLNSQPLQGGLVTVGGQNWRVSDVRPDGHGWILFILASAP